MARSGARTERETQDARHPLEELPGLDELAAAFRSLRSDDEVQRFLRDLCTLPELEALVHRWQIAQLVDEHVQYLQVAEQVGGSTATVTRVAQWLRHGTRGYRVALDRRNRRNRS